VWKTFFLLAAFFPLFTFANGGHAHDMTLPGVDASTAVEETSVREGLVVNMNVTPAQVFVHDAVRLDFFVNEKPGGVPVPFYDLDVEHAKLMHVVGVRNDLNEFRHIHPEPSPDNPAVFTIPHVFDQYDSYTFWSEISRGGTHFIFKHSEIDVGLTTETDPDQKTPDQTISLARNVIVGDYQIALTVPPRIAKGRTADFTFDVHTLVGDGVALEEYLGEPMHLVAIKDDLRQFLHAHPAEAHTHAINTLTPVAHAHGPTGDAPGYEPVNFHLAFPEAGFYKLFGQFRPQGVGLLADEALTSAFWIEVKDSTLTPVAERVILASVSLLLMAFLSYGVYRYIVRAA